MQTQQVATNGTLNRMQYTDYRLQVMLCTYKYSTCIETQTTPSHRIGVA